MKLAWKGEPDWGKLHFIAPTQLGWNRISKDHNSSEWEITLCQFDGLKGKKSNDLGELMELVQEKYDQFNEASDAFFAKIRGEK